MRNQLKEIDKKLGRIATACGNIQTLIVVMIIWFFAFGGGYQRTLFMIEQYLK